MTLKMLLCAALVLSFVRAGWSPPVKVFNQEGVATSIYTDRSNNVTHFCYGTQSNPRSLDTYQVSYRSLLPNGTFTPELLMASEAKLYRCTVIGADDGKTLHLTAFGPRWSWMDHCSEKGTGYCYDVYYTDSSDGGRSWTSWQRVSRANMSDATRRLGETTIYIQKTKRIFIFYSVGSYETINGLAFVTRPINSSVYSPETIFLRRAPKYINAGISATYTYLNGQPMLHVLWEEDDKVYYTDSLDSGLHWTEPRMMGNRTAGDLLVIPVARVYANADLNASVLFLMYTDHDKIMHLMVSRDNGRNFGPALNVTKPGHKGHTTVVCYDGNKSIQRAFVAHCNSNYEDEFNFYTYDFANNSLLELPRPFDNYEEISSPWITCLYEPNKKSYLVRMFTSYYGHYIVGGMYSTLRDPA